MERVFGLAPGLGNRENVDLSLLVLELLMCKLSFSGRSSLHTSMPTRPSLSIKIKMDLKSLGSAPKCSYVIFGPAQWGVFMVDNIGLK